MTATPAITGLTYDTYLDLTQIPAPHPVTPSPAEPAFITTHQTMEMWFGQQLRHLTAARTHLHDERLPAAADQLSRCRHITTLLREHLRILPHLVTPAEFTEFRTQLHGISGAHSARFRELETLSGLTPPDTGHTPGPPAGHNPEPSVWDAFVAACRRRNPPPGAFNLHDAIHRSPALADVAHALLAHDTTWAEWRTQHAQLAQTMIGHHPGTGGTNGVKFLTSRAHLRFYPALWAAIHPPEPDQAGGRA